MNQVPLLVFRFAPGVVQDDGYLKKEKAEGNPEERKLSLPPPRLVPNLESSGGFGGCRDVSGLAGVGTPSERGGGWAFHLNALRGSQGAEEKAVHAVLSQLRQERRLRPTAFPRTVLMPTRVWDVIEDLLRPSPLAASKQAP